MTILEAGAQASVELHVVGDAIERAKGLRRREHEQARVPAHRSATKGRPAEAKVIDSASVITAPWVRLKCKYGCEMYGREYCCPPETPTPEQTREILDGYRRAILFHYQAAKKEGGNRAKARKGFLDALVQLEGEMFKDGYYKAFALLSGPCSLCAECA